MAIFGRSNQVVRRRRDGRWAVVLSAPVRRVIEDGLDQVEELLDTPDHPLVARLEPPGYHDDPDREAAYRLLAGEELRESRRAAMSTVREIHACSEATEEDLWAWLRALNALRLVLGTALGIEDDDEAGPEEPDPDDPAWPMWQLYGLASIVQAEIIDALGS